MRISSKFNNYFVNVAQNLLRELGEANNKFQDFLKDPHTWHQLKYKNH